MPTPVARQRCGSAVLLLIVAWFTAIASAATGHEEPLIIFSIMTFSDLGHIVHVEGTLTGEGVGYRNNHSSLTCYQDKQECIVINIQAQGRQIFPLDLPEIIDVRLWTADRIVADFAAPCGNPPNEASKKGWQTTTSETWIIDRTRQTAELVNHPCNEARTYYWRIADPPFWKKAKGDDSPGSAK